MNALIPHLPALQVVVPLIAAPLCVVVGNGRVAWLIALLASLASFVIAAQLTVLVYNNDPINYPLGGWLAPFGIEYVVDAVNSFILLLVSGIGLVVVLFGLSSVEREIETDRHHLFWCTFTLCLTGLLGITITGDAFNIFVFLEISSLSSYALIAMGRNRKALTSSFQYLVMGTIGATFYLIGIGLLYMVTGTLNIADLQNRLPDVWHLRPVLAAFGFIVVGVALKLALFPLHLWLPNAYAYAPSVVSAFLAATATKVSIYVLLRVMFTMFGAGFAFVALPMHWVLLVPAVLAMFAGSFSAIFQNDIKRMLAYSSVAQIGYIVLGISIPIVDGLTASMLHVFNHALMKGALFCALGCVFYRIGSVRMEEVAGMGRDMPWTMACIVIGGLSLIGVPLTAGFVSKWMLLQAALEVGYWWLALLIVASSMLAVVYVWRVVEVMYFGERPKGTVAVREAPLSMLLPTMFLAGANIYFGIHSAMPVELSTRAATALLRGFW